MKFDIGLFFNNLPIKFNFLQNLTTITGTLHEMGWACGAYGLGEGCIQSWWGNRRGGDHWVDLGVDGWIIIG